MKKFLLVFLLLTSFLLIGCVSTGEGSRVGINPVVKAENVVEKIGGIVGGASTDIVTLEGTSEVILIDYFEENRAEDRYYINTPQGRFELVFPQNELFNLISGMNIKVKAKSIGNEGVIGTNNKIEVLDLEIISEGVVAGTEEENPNFGEQKVVVIMVKLIDSRENWLIDPEEVSNRIFNEDNPDSLNNYIREVSYNQAFITGDVFGWFTLPYTESEFCSFDNPYIELKNSTIEIADANIYYPNYNRMFIVVPWPGCLGTYASGVNDHPSNEGNITMTLSVFGGGSPFYTTKLSHLGHEFGHNIGGGGHANDWECGSEVTSNPSNCISIEYGNTFDMMGHSAGPGGLDFGGHYSAYWKAKRIGWLDSSKITEVTSDGIYNIEPLETNGSIKALTIPTKYFSYYIEYRQPIGFDSKISDEYGVEIYDGAMIYTDYTSGSGVTQLLDNSPHLNFLSNPTDHYFDSIDVILRKDETFYDSENNVIITTLDVTNDYLKVRIDIGDICGDGIVSGEEECDDGNIDNGDECNSSCELSFCQSGHEDNGNGTCTSILSDPFEDGSVFIDTEWVKNQEREQLFMGKNAATDWLVNRSYVEWNTSEIPNSAIIEDVDFLYEGGYQISSEIWDIYSKPSTSSPEEIFYDSGEGTAYITSGGFPEHGTSEISLPRTAIEHLQNQLTQNWFAIGMKSSNEKAGSGSWIESKESNDANPKPTLKVTYKPKPVCGDGVIEGTEQCDDGDTESCDGCNANCSRVDNVCGDDIKECSEVCERGDSKACRIGSIVGTKKCNSACNGWNSCKTIQTCFLKDTEIKTPNSNKKIQDLKIGDTVMSYNEQTGLMEPTKVIETFTHETDSYLIINGKLKVTPNHPLQVNGEWAEIGNAKIGDKIKTVNGEKIIGSIEVVNEKVEVFNIEVEKNHNYYANNYLAHNKVGGTEI